MTSVSRMYASFDSSDLFPHERPQKLPHLPDFHQMFAVANAKDISPRDSESGRERESGRVIGMNTNSLALPVNIHK